MINISLFLLDTCVKMQCCQILLVQKIQIYLLLRMCRPSRSSTCQFFALGLTDVVASDAELWVTECPVNRIRPAWSNTVINQYNFKTRLKCKIIHPSVSLSVPVVVVVVAEGGGGGSPKIRICNLSRFCVQCFDHLGHTDSSDCPYYCSRQFGLFSVEIKCEYWEDVVLRVPCQDYFQL